MYVCVCTYVCVCVCVSLFVVNQRTTAILSCQNSLEKLRSKNFQRTSVIKV